MPRPRLVSDVDVFAAFDASIAAHGPNGVTLAIVAQRLGITAPALMRRFGSKQGLFSAFMLHELAAQPTTLGALLAQHPNPLDAVLALSGETREYTVNRKAYLRHLASCFLQLADDDALGPIIGRWFTRERRWIAKRLDEARTRRELKSGLPVADLARTLQAALHGARLQWALGGAGAEGTWSARELDAVLTPWRCHPRRFHP